MAVLNENEARAYYKRVLSGDGVCTITEDEFVQECKSYGDQGLEIRLAPFDNLPTQVSIDRISMIRKAQELGQTTYESVILE